MKTDRFEITVSTRRGIRPLELERLLFKALTEAGHHPGPELIVDPEPLHHQEEREELERGEDQ